MVSKQPTTESHTRPFYPLEASPKTEMKVVLIIGVLVFLTSCGKVQNKKGRNEKVTSQIDSIAADTSSITVMKLDSTNNWLIKNSKPSHLSDREITKIEKIIKDCLSEYNVEQKKRFEQLYSGNFACDIKLKDFVIDLSNYQRQYIPTINNKGEKEVWINCFCRTFDRDWKKN